MCDDEPSTAKEDRGNRVTKNDPAPLYTQFFSGIRTREMIHLGTICVQIEERRGRLMRKHCPWWKFASTRADYIPLPLVNDGGRPCEVSYLSIIPYSARWMTRAVDRGSWIVHTPRPQLKSLPPQLVPLLLVDKICWHKAGWFQRIVLSWKRLENRDGFSQILNKEGSCFTGLSLCAWSAHLLEAGLGL
jgi:hypothetical protein